MPFARRQIDQPGARRADDFPATVEIVRRQAELIRENIHRAHRQQAERNIGAGHAVHDFVDRAVAAGGDDLLVAFRDRARASCSASPARTVAQKMRVGAERAHAFAHRARARSLRALGLRMMQVLAKGILVRRLSPFLQSRDA